MLKNFLLPLSVIVAGSSSASIMAQQRPSIASLQILDNHLGDSREDVDTRLLAKGYENRGDAYPKCDKEFDSLVAEFARNKTFKIPAGRLNCNELYVQGDNDVVAQYLLGQRGYILAIMTFQYKSSESSKSSVARFSKLYGKAKPGDGEQIRWYTGSSKQSPYFQYTRMGGTSANTIYGSKDMYDTFYEEAEKMVRRAAQ